MPDSHSLESLLQRNRLIEGWVRLVARRPPCTACSREGRLEPAVVEGEGAAGASLACARHASLDGPPDLGPGAGQVLLETGSPQRLDVPEGARPAGYARLIVDFQLSVLPPHRLTYVGGTSVRRELHREDGRIRFVLPPQLDPGPGLIRQLEFALKHDGVNLEVLAAFFRRVDDEAFEKELVEALTKKPYGKQLRRLWFLYEWLAERELPLPDLKKGNYLPLLDPKDYVVTEGRRSRRHRIAENLLGTRSFSPMVRCTPSLANFSGRSLAEKVRRLVEAFDPDALKRATQYLYTKETLSSFGIEGERPSARRVERFVAMLQEVPRLEALTQHALVRLQQETVDPRFADEGYREDQVYVATNLGLTRQRIEYIAPKAEDLASMMAGLLHCQDRLSRARVDPVIEAAVVSFAFVFIHPFSDGNGRLHRLLIHYVLSRRGFTPQDLIFPVSAVMEAKRAEYDACLESFSQPLMQLLDYEEDEDGVVEVQGDSAPYYRYFDATRMAEDLYRWVIETVETELPRELEFIAHYRQAREEMSEVVDLPDREVNLFIRLCRQNGGRLSQTKRASQFAFLTDAEVEALEQIVRTHLLPSKLSQSALPPALDTPEGMRPPRHTAHDRKPRQ